MRCCQRLNSNILTVIIILYNIKQQYAIEKRWMVVYRQQDIVENIGGG